METDLKKEDKVNTHMNVYIMLKDRRGATMAEYAVIAAVVAIVALAGFTEFGALILSKVLEVVAGL